MIFKEKEVENIYELFTSGKMGNYVVFPSFKIPAKEIEFDGQIITTGEFETPETKLYCIKNGKKKRQFLFDDCMFSMPIAPFLKDKEVCFKNSFLKHYLSNVFLESFKAIIDEEVFSGVKIKVDIPSKKDVFGDETHEPLKFFRYIKNRIAIFKNESDWWWLKTVYDKDAARFCDSNRRGYAYYNGASSTYIRVRPRLVIKVQAEA